MTSLHLVEGWCGRGFEVADESPTDASDRVHAQCLTRRFARHFATAGVEATVVLRAFDLALDERAVGEVHFGVRAQAVADDVLVIAQAAQHECALVEVDAS